MPPVERCTNHSFEVADRLCGECGRPFCDLCLVTPFKRRPPLCHRCAVALAGVRNGAKTAPVRTRKEIKAFERERRMAEARPEPKPPSEGGFGPGKPSFRTAASPPPATHERAKPEQPEEADEQAEAERAAKAAQAAQAGRNRPLRGLAR